MPRRLKIEGGIKPKRIRKKPTFINPTYASLKTGSQQKNPITFVACGLKVYVLRKLLLTEDVDLPAEVTVDLGEAHTILKTIDKYGIRVDERVQEATLSKNEFEDWCTRYNVNPNTSMYNLLTLESRTCITLNHIFKTKPGTFLPTSIAVLNSPVETKFWHKQRGRFENVNSRILFTGKAPEHVPSTDPPLQTEQKYATSPGFAEPFFIDYMAGRDSYVPFRGPFKAPPIPEHKKIWLSTWRANGDFSEAIYPNE